MYHRQDTQKKEWINTLCLIRSDHHDVKFELDNSILSEISQINETEQRTTEPPMAQRKIKEFLKHKKMRHTVHKPKEQYENSAERKFPTSNRKLTLVT